MVRYPREERQSLGSLENMRIRTSNGGEVPFSQVAQVNSGRGNASIRRVDRHRAVSVTASVDPEISSAASVLTDMRERVLPEVLADFPGVFYTFDGAQAEQEEAVGGLREGLILSLTAIFALLGVALRSYLQPLIIMGAIPFGFVGGLCGHLLLGLDLSFLSMLGFVALTGVVVNDSLIMVDFINRAQDARAQVNQLDGPAACLHRSGAGDPRSGRPAVPPHTAHVAHDLHRSGADDARPQPAGGGFHSDGGLPRVRGLVRDLNYTVSGADRLPDPRRPATPAAAAAGSAQTGHARAEVPFS